MLSVPQPSQYQAHTATQSNKGVQSTQDGSELLEWAGNANSLRTHGLTPFSVPLSSRSQARSTILRTKWGKSTPSGFKVLKTHAIASRLVPCR